MLLARFTGLSLEKRRVPHGDQRRSDFVNRIESQEDFVEVKGGIGGAGDEACGYYSDGGEEGEVEVETAKVSGTVILMRNEA